MDKFDDIWKNNFHSEQQPHYWNTPDPSVWESVRTKLTHQKVKYRILFWWIWAINVSFLVGLSILSMPAFVNEVEQLTALDNLQQIKEYHQAMDRSLVDSSNVEPTPYLNIGKFQNSGYIFSERISPSNLDHKATVGFHSPLQDSISNVNTSVIPPKNGNESHFSNTFDDVHDLSYLQDWRNSTKDTTDDLLLNNPIKFDESVFDRKNLISPRLDKPLPKVLSKSPEIPVFSSHRYYGLDQYSMLGHHRALVPENTDIPKSIRAMPILWKFEFSAGLFGLAHHISHNMRQDLEPFDFNYKSKTGKNIFVGISRYLGDFWDMSFGIDLSWIRTLSGHNGILTYRLEEESEDNHSNEYNIQLATPYGLAPGKFVIGRSSDISEDVLTMPVDFFSQHRLVNLRLNQSVSYFPVGRSMRWAPFIQLSLGVNRLLMVTSELYQIECSNSQFYFADPIAPVDLTNNIRSVYLTGGIGSGFIYRMERGSLIINMYLNKTVSPLYQEGSHRTGILQYGMMLGYQFCLL